MEVPGRKHNRKVGACVTCSQGHPAPAASAPSHSDTTHMHKMGLSQAAAITHFSGRRFFSRWVYPQALIILWKTHWLNCILGPPHQLNCRVIYCGEGSEDCASVAPTGTLSGPQCDYFCMGSNESKTLKFRPILGEDRWIAKWIGSASKLNNNSILKILVIQLFLVQQKSVFLSTSNINWILYKPCELLKGLQENCCVPGGLGKGESSTSTSVYGSSLSASTLISRAEVKWQVKMDQSSVEPA